MICVKATKTQLYALVSAQGNQLPPLRHTTFWKAPKRPDYYLEWDDATGHCKASFMGLLGRVALRIWRSGGQDSVQYLTIEELRTLRMIEEDRL